MSFAVGILNLVGGLLFDMCRQSEYAVRKREAIFEILGRRCVVCGSREELEFDVIRPVGEAKSHHGVMSWGQRMKFYCRQLSDGNLQVLCSRCNSSKKNREEQYLLDERLMIQDGLVDCPF